MQHIVVIGVIIVAIVIYIIRKHMDSNNSAEAATDDETENKENTTQETQESVNEKSEPTPIEIHAEFIEVLKSLGAQVEPADEERKNVIVFEYQSETFVTYTDEKSYWLSIYDYRWANVDCSDIEGFSQYRKAINEVNKGAAVSVYYEIVKEDDDRQVATICSQREVLFSGTKHYTKSYIAGILRSFFEAQRAFTHFLAEQTAVEEA